MLQAGSLRAAMRQAKQAVIGLGDLSVAEGQISGHSVGN